MPDKKEYKIGDSKIGGMRRRRGPGGGFSGEKPKNFGKAIGKLIAYCKKYLPAIISAIILAATGSILNIIGPDRLSDMTKLIASGIVSGIDMEKVVRIAVTLLILYAVGALFNLLQGLIMADVTQRVSKGLRSDISEKINRLPLGYFDKSSTGDTLSRVTNDVDTIGQSLNQSLGTLISAITMFTGCLIMMFYTNALIAISGILASFAGFFIMMLIMGNSQKLFIRQQEQLGALNGHIEETYAGHQVIKAYNGEGNSRKEFKRLNEGLYDSAWKSQFLSGLMFPLMGFIGNFGYVVVCVVGAVLTMNKTIGFEVIVAFMLYIRLFTQPLSQIAQAAASLQSAAAAGERVFGFLEEAEMSDESGKKTELNEVKGDIEFKDVRFGYSKDKTIINDFSAKVKAGQNIAIVGPTGAGKTTMVNLLMRFYETDGGEITIDGIPTSELTRENIHRLFCMVLQDTWLFEGTIKENIVYAKENVTDEEVIKACKDVGLHSFIKTLSDGYNTVLDDNTNLSAGQRQLITIARAMVENSPMLILDEATSSVDTRTEVLIRKAMNRLTVGRTAFIIAHRLSTIRNADLILVMKDGDIVESGNHDELMRNGGFYSELYNSQFEAAG